MNSMIKFSMELSYLARGKNIDIYIYTYYDEQIIVDIGKIYYIIKICK